MWLRLPVGRLSWRSHPEWPLQNTDRHPTVAHLFVQVPQPAVRNNAMYYYYTNELDSLHPSQIEWEPYRSQEIQDLGLNAMCEVDHNMKALLCPLVCFYAVEFLLCHRVMRQFGRRQRSPPLNVSTSIDLHKLDSRKNKWITDWSAHHVQHNQH
ncbi:hypothetical protein E2562_028595 [Oryza meyeriana var. granulata]|uniref:Aminotransferase-like plant mobile domain-containing protein n=1 Tax=Oryza meyeriana var. granulata TaxID=110450 RepID=A0A6G1DAM1_9ORYZ|nr:hypothetical protein E2562_028595 [Oryza meyeriana var. granulata]